MFASPAARAFQSGSKQSEPDFQKPDKPMSLNRSQLATFVSLIRSTKPDRLDCQSCSEILARFVEREGDLTSDDFSDLPRHLEQCACCREECDLLREAVRELAGLS
ncbi:hypothetical protein RSSM_02640 [Rhodopirellula sallentina SM41]|uniref:Zinc-finger domain-containing protein n=1 Tax=Rhodopirellula sallentina SM41 TaxID=1263870 RepID=M5UDJ9_9BACT|nr:hypothetical protein RSSM_02640 [Rhodopirellula sallentina SM41]